MRRSPRYRRQLGKNGNLPCPNWQVLLWMIGLLAIVLLSCMPALALLHRAVPDGGPVLNGAANIVASSLALLGYSAAVNSVEKRRPVEVLSRRAFPELLFGLMIGTLLFAGVMTILVASRAYRVTWLGWAPAWSSASLSIRAGVIEEVVFRGIILRLLWSGFGLRIALAVSAVVFGAIHLVNPGTTIISSLSIALEAGVMLGAFYALKGRLWLPIGVHGAWDFAQSYLFGAMVSGQDLGPALARSTPEASAPTWLTGGTFGPEASPVALIVCSAAAAFVLVKSATRRRRIVRDGRRYTTGS